MVPIVQKDNKILRKKALKVPIKEISSVKIKKIIKDMKTALAGEKDGVAIAAPQIGEALQIFVVSGIVIEMLENQKKDKDVSISTNLQKEKTQEDLVFINPEILKLSKEKSWVEEGCLSCRYLYGKMNRAKKAVVRAYDENGKVFERGGSGLLAQIFQHETDHLKGILFIDSAKDVEDIPPEK